MPRKWFSPNARMQRSRWLVVMLALLLALMPSAVAASGPEKRPARASYALLQAGRARPNDIVRVIVQKKHGARGVQDKVRGRAGRILKEVPMIEGLVVELPARAVDALSREAGVHWITLDAPMQSSAVLTSTVANLANAYARSTGADRLWQEPSYLDGQGISVAVVDSGVGNVADLQGLGSSRIITSVVTNNSVSDASDENGHGTHVAGIIGGNGATSNGARIGIAPGVNLVNVRVSDSQGRSYVSDVVEGLQWIQKYKDTFNIRVVNISINSTVAEPYNTSPLDAAVEMLWCDGIVVVVSAGNNGNGSTPVTVYPPANDPLIITVGAVDDAGTATLADDTSTNFSAYGTTEDNHAKPDLVAPGSNIISLLPSTSARLYLEHPANRVDDYLFRMSGTSMAAPMVSGAVALLLQDEPSLTPNQVKYRLMVTANRNWPGYNAGKMGAGYLDVYAAVHATTVQAGNQGVPPCMLLAKMAMIAYWANNQGGSIDWSSVNWDSVNWDSVNWDSVNWDSVNWDSVNWDSVNWDSVNWDSVNWDSVNWDSVNWDSVNWDSVNWDSVNWDSVNWDSGS